MKTLVFLSLLISTNSVLMSMNQNTLLVLAQNKIDGGSNIQSLPSTGQNNSFGKDNQQKERVIPGPNNSWGIAIDGGSNIQSLPSSRYLTILQLYDVQLKNLDLRVIAHALTGLVQLSVKRCAVEQITWPDTSIFPYLELLDVSENNLTEINFSPLAFCMPSIVRVNFAKNNINKTRLKTNTIKRPTLKTIDFSENKLELLPGNIFTIFVGLTQVLRSNNKITIIDKSNKLYIPNSNCTIDLSNNQIAYIDPGSIVRTARTKMGNIARALFYNEPTGGTTLKLDGNKLAFNNMLELVAAPTLKGVIITGLDTQK